MTHCQTILPAKCFDLTVPSMSNKTRPWFGAARRISERRSDSYGLAVDEDGVTLGPNFPLVRKTSRGYEPATLRELSCLCEVVALGVSDTHRLARHLESIAKALTAGDLAKARILGLYFPINRLTPNQLAGLRKASTLLKQFNPDEPRDNRGRWTTGAATAASANGVAQTRGRSGTRARHDGPGSDANSENVPPIDPEILPDVPVEGEPPPVKGEPPIEEEPFFPYSMAPKWLNREYCLDAARRSPDNMAPWESMCRNLPPRFRQTCWAAGPPRRAGQDRRLQQDLSSKVDSQCSRVRSVKSLRAASSLTQETAKDES